MKTSRQDDPTQLISSVFTGRGLLRDSVIYWIVVAGLALSGALIGDNYIRHVFILVFIWCIVIASWDLILGYAGIFNYAQLVFFAVGAYSSAMLSIYAGFTPLLSIACAAIFGGAVGALIAIPSLRLKGEYVALFTFAVHLALPPVIQQGKAIGMGGHTGLLGVPWLNLFGYQVSTIDKLTWFWVSLAFGAVCVYVIYFVVLRGRMGLAFVAMRDAGTFAQSIGVNENKYKFLAFGRLGCLHRHRRWHLCPLYHRGHTQDPGHRVLSDGHGHDCGRRHGPFSRCHPWRLCRGDRQRTAEKL